MSDSNKHTPEPWYASNEGGEWRVMTVDENGGYTLADMCCGDQEANARRIAACVNALEGLNDYALLGGWSFRGIEAYAKGLEKQRDVLLAALQRQVDNIERWLETDIPASPEESKSIYEQMVSALASTKSNHTEQAPEMVETSAPAIVFYPAGSLGEEVNS